MCTKIKISQKTSLENPPSQVESAPEPASSAPEPSAPPSDGEAGDGKEEVLTFNPMAEEATEAGAIPMAANAIRQEAEMAHGD